MNTSECTDHSENGSAFLKKSDLIWTIFANIITITAAVLIGLFMPALTDYETYAGYRGYTLFVAYVQFVQLGFVNGMSLRYGNLDKNKLPAGLFRSYTRFLILSQFFIILLAAPVLYAAKGFKLTPFIFVILTILPDNMRLYYGAVYANTGRFKENALCQIIYRLSLLICFAALFITKKNGWIYYLGCTLILNMLSFLNYILVDPTLTFGRAARERGFFSEVKENIRRGAPVMFGEQLGILMLGADSMFALFLFDSRQFSFYSFAVYVVVTAYTVLNAANAVIFPYLKRLDKKDMGSRYSFLKKMSLGMFIISVPAFIPARMLINRYMENYAGALPYLDILMFTLLFRLLGEMACANAMKAMDMETEFFKSNLAACILAFVADALAYVLWRDLRMIAAASVLVYAVWFFICDMKIRRRLQKI